MQSITFFIVQTEYLAPVWSIHLLKSVYVGEYVILKGIYAAPCSFSFNEHETRKNAQIELNLQKQAISLIIYMVFIEDEL